MTSALWKDFLAFWVPLPPLPFLTVLSFQQLKNVEYYLWNLVHEAHPLSEIFFNLVAVTILQVWWVNKHLPTKVRFFPTTQQLYNWETICVFVCRLFLLKRCVLMQPYGTEERAKERLWHLRELMESLLRREVCVEDASRISSAMSGVDVEELGWWWMDFLQNTVM